MNRAMIIITSQAERDKATRWAQGVSVGTRIEFKEPKRTLPQNDRFWAMLTDIAEAMKERGREYAPDQWKVIFMAAYGHEVKFLPSLDQKSFIPVGHSSSDLGVREMSDLMEFMSAWAAENGIALNDHKTPDPDPASSPVSDPEAGEVDPPSSSPASLEPDTDLLIKTFRLLWAARGPDPEVVDNQARAMKADFADANEVTTKRAKTVKEHIKMAGIGKNERGQPYTEADALEYIAGVIGVEPAELMKGTDA